MKPWIPTVCRIVSRLVCLLALAALAAGCANSRAREGQRLFAGCLEAVDEEATARTGLFVCRGGRVPDPFGGNGRACGDCHVPGDNYGISAQRIAGLHRDHPFFYPGLDEDQQLLRHQGLVHVVAPNVDEFRRTPTLVHLQDACDDYGFCYVLGLLGDRNGNLCVFAAESIANHMARSTDRVEDVDFRLPTVRECDALVAFLLSDLFAEQADRNREARRKARQQVHDE